MNIGELAENALAEIEAKPKGSVYASRKGIVAGLNPGRGMRTIFRRVNDKVRLEVWMAKDGQRQPQTYTLPDDLERRAGKMLDNL